MKNSFSSIDPAFREPVSAFDDEGQAVSRAPVPARRSRLWNAAVGMLEKCRPYPSDRARQEYLDYYAGLYQDQGPNPARFRELLLRNGRPFMVNPFPEGSPEHYLYHPEGLGLADLEAILESQAQDWKAMSKSPQEPEKGARWPSIDEAISSQNNRLREVEREWALQGGVCWGMLLMHPGSLDWLRERVHTDNLAWATVHALNKSPWSKWGVDRSRVLSRALEHNLFSQRVAESLFSRRSM